MKLLLKIFFLLNWSFTLNPNHKYQNIIQKTYDYLSIRSYPIQYKNIYYFLYSPKNHESFVYIVIPTTQKELLILLLIDIKQTNCFFYPMETDKIINPNTGEIISNQEIYNYIDEQIKTNSRFQTIENLDKMNILEINNPSGEKNNSIMEIIDFIIKNNPKLKDYVTKTKKQNNEMKKNIENKLMELFNILLNNIPHDVYEDIYKKNKENQKLLNKISHKLQKQLKNKKNTKININKNIKISYQKNKCPCCGVRNILILNIYKPHYKFYFSYVIETSYMAFTFNDIKNKKCLNTNRKNKRKIFIKNKKNMENFLENRGLIEKNIAEIIKNISFECMDTVLYEYFKETNSENLLNQMILLNNILQYINDQIQ